VTTRRNTPRRSPSPSAMVGYRACEIAAYFQGAKPKSYLYPNGYTILSQRIASTTRNHSHQCHDDQSFRTIHHQKVWPSGCETRRNWQSVDGGKKSTR